METRSRIVFTQGGKGGVGKTTIITAFVGWARSKGLDPVLMDFDFENREKSSLQSFYGEAQKIDIHKPDALDKLFHNLETPGTLVIVDHGTGMTEQSGIPTAALLWSNEKASYSIPSMAVA
jgi:GTPase SAR1 family protein